MTKKLKDSLHATLNACYNGDNAAEAVKSFMKDNKEELKDTHVWNKVVDKIQSRLKEHNKRAESDLHIGDSESLYMALSWLRDNDEESFNQMADKCLRGLK